MDHEEVNAQPFSRTRRSVLLPHRRRLMWQSRPKPRVFWPWIWQGCGRRYLQFYRVTLRHVRLLPETNRYK
ncbi:hypothetical protein J2850_006249 [Azospirillum picis]|uniref:Uncharacterized protein n=2 Tax=Azospirillum picis TaxID=488438 RepID=A0ABU0MVD4_9PROT|nr:hypothetical protein [Azospirillum picis]MBP2303502.1 hypothetical protein [Azospirillum picis]MDQ0537381.1 hypothetical protein [Azospirillum picis]